MTIKCITIWQPWASAVALGLKRFETRSWDTGYRGPIAIHAAKRKMTREEEAEYFLANPTMKGALNGAGVLSPNDLPYGAIIAVAILDRTHPTAMLSRSLSRQEITFGDYTPGRYAWEFDGITAIPEPIPYTGRQGLYEIPRELVQEWISSPF